jgi:two-component system, chemotaxis family, chemotaxis protein CheY
MKSYTRTVGGPRVLLVEDSSTMRSFVVTALETAGIVDVIQVPSGFAALQALPHGRFDLVITDVNMPDINGLELIRFVRQSPGLAGLPLIVISTEGRPRDRDRCLKLGADEYLAKPFSPAALVDAAWRLLHRGASQER